MNSDSPSLEHELRGLKPAAFDEAFLSRLEACAAGTDLEATVPETRFEAGLRGIAPAALPADFLAALESRVAGLPFPVNEKIVLFPKGGTTSRARSRRPWAAAAAVALIGGLSALLLPGTGRQPAQAAASPPSSISPAVPNIVPADYRSGLSEARDEGVLWNSGAKPQRVVRVVYTDRVTVRNADGRTIEVERPRVEYVLVPEKID